MPVCHRYAIHMYTHDTDAVVSLADSQKNMEKNFTLLTNSIEVKGL